MQKPALIADCREVRRGNLGWLLIAGRYRRGTLAFLLMPGGPARKPKSFGNPPSLG